MGERVDVSGEEGGEEGGGFLWVGDGREGVHGRISVAVWRKLLVEDF